MKLKYLPKLLFISSLILSLTACQKEVDFQDQNGNPNNNPGPGNTGSINGDYDFVGVAGKDTTTVISNDSGMELKAVAISDYSTESNSGTLKITDNQLIITNLSYRMKDTVQLLGYLDGMLMAGQSQPVDQTIPPTSNTADYVRSHPDSITVSNSGVMLPDPSGNPSTVPGGPQTYGISLNNDVLTMTLNYDFTTTGIQNGLPATMRAQMNVVMKFKKK